MRKQIYTLLLLALTVTTATAQTPDLLFNWANALNNDQPLGGNVVGLSIKVDASGNTYITGYFNATADFDPGAGTANLTSAGNDDIFIAKYDASGNYVYAKAIGGSSNERGNSIAIDGSGNAYLTGYFGLTADFDPGAGTANLTSVSGPDIFFAKYDASGNYVYAKAMGGGRSDQGNSIAVDASGNVYITGSFQATVDFDPGAGVVSFTENSASVGDIFLAKYDASGNYVYAKQIGGINSDNGNSLAIDGSGNAYITGSFQATVDFDPGAGTAILTSAGFSDIFLAKYDASGNYVYAKKIGGTNSDNGNSLAIDGSGNAYITGSFQATVDFDPGAGTVNLTSAGFSDIFLAKYDASGNYVYAKQIGGTNSDNGNSLAIDGSGNAYITGSFQATVDFDPGVGTANLTSAGFSDFFLAKYDASGNYVYAKKIGGTNSDNGNALAIDGSGNAYLTGIFSGTVDFDPGAGTADLTAPSGVSNAYIGKYDASGLYVRAGLLGDLAGSSSEGGLSIASDASGNTYITGFFQGTVDFDPGAGTASLTSSGGQDIFIAKYNASGNYVYAKSMGGTSNDYGYSIAIDGSGNAYIIGYFSGTADFDPGAGTANLSSLGGEDIFLAKYDASGNYVYAKSMGGTSADYGYSIAIDGSGNAYITGFFQGTADFDPSAGTANLTSAGFVDVFIAKYDASGNYIFAKRIGGTSFDYASSIAIDGSGNAYITGFFQGTADFDPGAGTVNLTSAGNEDIFIAKYDASGNYIYAKRLGGTSFDYARSIAIDGSGNTYITGNFSGTADFDPAAGTFNLTSAGGDDVFIAKYDASGNYIYAKRMGGTSSDVGNSIAIDASGNAYIVGSFQGTADFDPGAGNANLTGVGSNDIFLAKYDTSGNYIYAKGMGGIANEFAYSMAIDASGNAYVTGNFSGTADFDPGAGTANLTAINSSDIFIARYTESTLVTWTGVVQYPGFGPQVGNWNEPGNWSSGVVPTAINNVFIPNSTPRFPLITNPVTVNRITLQNGSYVSISYNNPPLTIGSLTVNDSVVNEGNLYLVGDGHAGFLQSDTCIYVGGGTFRVQLGDDQFNTADGYRNISSPVQSATVADIAAHVNVFGQDAVNCWYAYSPYPNVQVYDEALSIVNGNYYEGWRSYTGLSNPLTAMKGIAVRTYGQEHQSLYLEGTPNNGPKSINITKTNSATVSQDGWNMIGNPYPSTILWSEVKALNPGETDASYYVFHTTGEYTGNWGSHNGVTGTNGATNEIAPMQGFFVKATGNHTFNMDNSVRSINQSLYFKNTTQPNEIRLQLSGNNNSDEIVAYTDGTASWSFDAAHDAEKMAAGSTVYMSYKQLGKEYAINVIDEITETTELPLVIWAQDTGSYTFEATELNVTGYITYLKDALANTLTNLDSNTVTLQLNGQEVYEGRYSIVFEEIEVVEPSGIAGINEGKTKIYSHQNIAVVERNNDQPATITISNTLGQTIKEVTTDNKRTEILLDNINPWYAIVKVKEANTTHTGKVLIK